MKCMLFKVLYGFICPAVIIICWVLLIFSVSGVAIKNDTVLLTMEKGAAVWSCPSFTFDDSEDAANALVTGMKKNLNVDVEPASILYKNEEKNKVFVGIKKITGKVENIAYEKVQWIDTEQLPNLDIVYDSRLAILKCELVRGQNV